MKRGIVLMTLLVLVIILSDMFGPAHPWDQLR